MASASEKMALDGFIAENKVEEIEADNEFYKFDAKADGEFRDSAVWEQDPHYFKNVKMSALALLKMVMHARKGGNIEVMGLMQGKFEDGTFVVMDAFPLPVEGTETRVSAQDEAYTYMFAYIEEQKKVGRLDEVVGWYHSHPGYGCWLSGIDVSTQRMQQQGMGPFLAVVIDPTRTCTAGKVEIGAFRVYPDGYKPPDEGPSEYQTVPLDKIEDFGVHSKSYYSLDISYFKSSLDRRLLELLWNRYWVSTMSSSAILANKSYISGQLMDLANKLQDVGGKMGGGNKGPGAYALPEKKKEETPLAKCTRDSLKTTIEMVHGVTHEVLKDLVFNRAVQRS
eukprot:m.259674 g.259674  ORF g.259674 m.259674 type:complete len:338 (+) comp38499_c0_seq1:174-1187(+)